jgi:hypothetical protein
LNQCRLLQARTAVKEIVTEAAHRMKVELRAGQHFFKQRCIAEMRKNPYFAQEMLNEYNTYSKKQ